jgi:hypothetical protein
VPALPSSILDPCGSRSPRCSPPTKTPIRWAATALGIPDRVVFDKLIQPLVFGCDYRRIADHTCSATTLRRRRDEWISAGVAEQLRLAVLAADDRIPDLELEQLAVYTCTTKAPCGGQTAGPSPIDRRNKGCNARSSPRRAASRWPWQRHLFFPCEESATVLVDPLMRPCARLQGRAS